MRTQKAVNLKRLAGLIEDERGSVMLEFVLIAPLLSFLIVATLFFRNQIDYAMDSVVRARHEEWRNALPGKAESASGTQSDGGDFFMPPIRGAIAAAGTMRADGSVGGVLAATMFFETPYDTLQLPCNNYMFDPDKWIDPLPLPEEPWAGILSGLGTFFGEKIGTGSVTQYQGLKGVGWIDRFPVMVHPWMRLYSDKLDPASNILVKIIMGELNVLTLGRIPTPRVDTRDDVDIGKSNIDSSLIFPEQSNSKLQLTRISGKSRVQTIVQ
jgi:Flp pilus assembly pilin Flp